MTGLCPWVTSSAAAGAAPGTLSVVTSAGGILTDGDMSLANSAVAAAGGFTMNVWFNWNGTDLTSFGHTQKLIDYAGTESLQLVTTTGSASLQMAFADDSGNESVPVSTTILPNTWYRRDAHFRQYYTGRHQFAGCAGNSEPVR